METQKFWSRVGHWFAKSDRDAAFMGEAAPAPSETSSTPAPDQPPGADPSTDDAVVPSSKGRRLRPVSGIQRIEEDHARVVGLVDAIETHLTAQTEQSEKMAASLDRLAESLAHTPAASQAQKELLTQICEAVKADVACSKRLEDGISQMPQLADAQREAMVSLDRHLEQSCESTQQVSATMSEVQAAVVRLGDATDASSKSAERMRGDDAARDERLAGLIEDQIRRLATFAWCAVALAAAAVVLGLVAILR